MPSTASKRGGGRPPLAAKAGTNKPTRSSHKAKAGKHQAGSNDLTRSLLSEHNRSQPLRLSGERPSSALDQVLRQDRNAEVVRSSATEFADAETIRSSRVSDGLPSFDNGGFADRPFATGKRAEAQAGSNGSNKAIKFQINSSSMVRRTTSLQALPCTQRESVSGTVARPSELKATLEARREDPLDDPPVSHRAFQSKKKRVPEKVRPGLSKETKSMLGFDPDPIRAQAQLAQREKPILAPVSGPPSPSKKKNKKAHKRPHDAAEKAAHASAGADKASSAEVGKASAATKSGPKRKKAGDKNGQNGCDEGGSNSSSSCSGRDSSSSDSEDEEQKPRFSAISLNVSRRKFKNKLRDEMASSVVRMSKIHSQLVYQAEQKEKKLEKLCGKMDDLLALAGDVKDSPIIGVDAEICKRRAELLVQNEEIAEKIRQAHDETRMLRRGISQEQDEHLRVKVLLQERDEAMQHEAAEKESLEQLKNELVDLVKRTKAKFAAKHHAYLYEKESRNQKLEEKRIELDLVREKVAMEEKLMAGLKQWDAELADGGVEVQHSTSVIVKSKELAHHVDLVVSLDVEHDERLRPDSPYAADEKAFFGLPRTSPPTSPQPGSPYSRGAPSRKRVVSATMRQQLKSNFAAIINNARLAPGYSSCLVNPKMMQVVINHAIDAGSLKGQAGKGASISHRKTLERMLKKVNSQQFSYMQELEKLEHRRNTILLARTLCRQYLMSIATEEIQDFEGLVRGRVRPLVELFGSTPTKALCVEDIPTEQLVVRLDAAMALASRVVHEDSERASGEQVASQFVDSLLNSVFNIATSQTAAGGQEKAEQASLASAVVDEAFNAAGAAAVAAAAAAANTRNVGGASVAQVEDEAEHCAAKEEERAEVATADGEDEAEKNAGKQQKDEAGKAAADEEDVAGKDAKEEGTISSKAENDAAAGPETDGERPAGSDEARANSSEGTGERGPEAVASPSTEGGAQDIDQSLPHGVATESFNASASGTRDTEPESI